MFHAPWYFCFLLALPLILWRWWRPVRKPSLAFSSTSGFAAMAPSLRQRLIWLPNAFAVLSILFLVTGLAQPREGREKTVTDSEGIAIELVVDRSGSMRAMDFQINERNVDRLTAIKRVASEFIEGDDELEGRFSDLIGLMVFAGYADPLTPPTLDHSFVTTSLYNTQIVRDRSEDGTAIGDAIALAVEKLNALDDNKDQEIQSKIIILLTDGENTAGELAPIEAAEIAQAMGIKVYTIGVGTRGQAPIPTNDPFTGRSVYRWINVNIDEKTLKEVAEKTDGKYFRATDTESLKKIYKEIDELEKTKVETTQFTDYRELAVQPFQNSWVALPPALWLAFMCLATRQLLALTWLKEAI